MIVNNYIFRDRIIHINVDESTKHKVADKIKLSATRYLIVEVVVNEFIDYSTIVYNNYLVYDTEEEFELR